MTTENRCDYCGKKLDKKRIPGKLSFCDRKCNGLAARKGGVSYRKAMQTNNRRYGTDWSQNNAEIIEKRKNTNRERYGAENPYGSLKIKKQIRETVKKRYSVTNVFQDEGIKKRIRESTIKKIGVPYAIMLPSVKEAAKSADAKRKHHETMKLRGNYKKRMTRPESIMLRMLREVFEEGDIIFQELLNDTWPIDFYVKSVDSYIQVDGVYWHGLDRSLEIIKEFKTPRDRMIYRKFLTDREQDKWAKEHGINLLRFTDLEIIKDAEKTKARLKLLVLKK